MNRRSLFRMITGVLAAPFVVKAAPVAEPLAVRIASIYLIPLHHIAPSPPMHRSVCTISYEAMDRAWKNLPPITEADLQWIDHAPQAMR